MTGRGGGAATVSPATAFTLPSDISISSFMPLAIAAGAAQRLARVVAHQRIAALEHVLVGESGQQLLGTFKPRETLIELRLHGTCGAPAQGDDTIAVAQDAGAIGLRIGGDAGLEPMRQGLVTVAAARHQAAHELRRQAAGAARIVRVVDLRIGAAARAAAARRRHRAAGAGRPAHRRRPAERATAATAPCGAARCRASSRPAAGWRAR